MKITKTQLKEMIKEAVQEQLERSSMEQEYPELWEAASEIRMQVVPLINDAARSVETDMPYKAQAILESLIEQLQELV